MYDCTEVFFIDGNAFIFKMYLINAVGKLQLYLKTDRIPMLLSFVSLSFMNRISPFVGAF